MREIKFRALKDDISNCRFYYGNLIYDKQGNPRIYDVDTDLFHTCIKGTETQYTGLKDKNGKEIYEGDVLNFRANYTNKPCGYINGIVTINPLGLILKVGELEYNALEECEGIEYLSKVIGNIYENPELL